MERGLLTGKYESINAFSDTDHRSHYFKRFDFSEVKKLTNNLQTLAEKYSVTTAQLVLAWTFHQPGVTAALAGARNAKQAEENAKAMYITLSDDDRKLINSWLNEKFVII